MAESTNSLIVVTIFGKVQLLSSWTSLTKANAIFKVNGFTTNVLYKHILNSVAVCKKAV